jgi:hypothetical protein
MKGGDYASELLQEEMGLTGWSGHKTGSSRGSFIAMASRFVASMGRGER